MFDDETTNRAADAPHAIHEGVPPLVLEGVDPLSYRVFTAFTAMMRANQKVMGKAFSAEGSHPGQGGCLIALAHHDGLSQREIADRLHLTPPTITSMLQRMEKTGVVVRRPDAEDQRLVRVYLTEAGRALESEVRGVIASHINRVVGAMSENDRIELARLLELMARNINREADDTAAEDVRPVVAAMTEGER